MITSPSLRPEQPSGATSTGPSMSGYAPYSLKYARRLRLDRLADRGGSLRPTLETRRTASAIDRNEFQTRHPQRFYSTNHASLQPLEQYWDTETL